MDQYLIVLQAGNEGHEGMARAYHALLCCKDFTDRGNRARLIFAGGGGFGAKDAVQKSFIPLRSEFHGHPSLGKYAAEGCSIIVI